MEFSAIRPGSASVRLLSILFAAALIALLLLLFATMTLRGGGPLAPLATLPTPTPTNTPVPPGVIDFSAQVLTASNNGGTCDSSGVPTHTCRIAAGTTFSVGVRLKEIGNVVPGGNYTGYDARLDYIGVTSAETPASVTQVWPDCVAPANTFLPGSIRTGCANAGGPQQSTYEGLLVNVEFTCTMSGFVFLEHGTSGTALSDDGVPFSYYEDEGTDESLLIDCVTPQGYPADNDGDTCPDAREQQTAAGSELSGGRRNFLKPWDYFNPTHDGLNRIDDILAVLNKGFIDDDDANPGQPPYEPGYTPDTDRSAFGPDFGPNVWNLGPPNGQHRIDDVLNMVKHYFHDCS